MILRNGDVVSFYDGNTYYYPNKPLVIEDSRSGNPEFCSGIADEDNIAVTSGMLRDREEAQRRWLNSSDSMIEYLI